MTVSAINGGGSQWYAQAQKPPSPPAMADTANLFGLSTSQLSQDLQSGTTLSSLASQDGVSSSSLTSAIESDLQSGAPQGAPAPSGDQLQQMATNIADGTPPASPGGQDQAGASQLVSGQSLASALAANAYAGSATEAASSTSASSQVNQYI